MIQIRYVDSKNQLADILTRGLCTRDGWNHLLYLINISLFSFQSCVESNSQNCSDALAKRQQEGDYDERVVAESWYRGAVRDHQRRHLRRYLQARGNSDQKITN